MSEYYPPTESERKDPVTQRWGCWVLIIAAVLFGVERFLLFNVLIRLAGAGSHLAEQTLAFLFGNPPYSFFDVLLGFQMPEEGLFYLLQPHNILLGMTQAVHYAVNLAIAYSPFWLLEKLRARTESHPFLRLAGCLALLLAAGGLITAVVTCVDSQSAPSGQPRIATPSAAPQWSSYSNATAGVRFSYPAYMTIEDATKKDRGPSGELITTTTITATSKDPVIGLLVRTIEDPLRNQMYPGLYPVMPGDAFRILVVGEIANLNWPKTDANQSAAATASDKAVITTIAGFQAATYQVALEGTALGHVLIHGALIITDKRDVSLCLMGSDEANAAGSADSASLAAIWTKLYSSLALDF